jgi:hypothetical protein
MSALDQQQDDMNLLFERVSYYKKLIEVTSESLQLIKISSNEPVIKGNLSYVIEKLNKSITNPIE